MGVWALEMVQEVLVGPQKIGGKMTKTIIKTSFLMSQSVFHSCYQAALILNLSQRASVEIDRFLKTNRSTGSPQFWSTL